MATRQPHIMISVNCLYRNSHAKSTKMAKIEVANTQLPVSFETVLFFLKIVYFVYVRFLMCCHQYCITSVITLIKNRNNILGEEFHDTID